MIKITVRTKTIKELIDQEIPSGQYWLPSFQRQYVWDEDNIKELLDSIIQNYPIGATILWKPSLQIASSIDPTSVPIMDISVNNQQDRYFVIDGQQRMTSVLLLFNGWKLMRDGETITCARIAYNPNENKFIKHPNRGIDCSKIVKAFCQHDVDALTELKNSTTGEHFQRMSLIAQAILGYPIPQYLMETIGEGEEIFPKMAETFIRINKEGMRIGNVELMLSFLAGTLSGDLKARVESLYRTFKDKDVAMQPIMRSVFSNFGLSQTQLAKPKQFKANIAKIREIPSADIEAHLEKSERALRLTFEFLEAEFGIKSVRILPSQTSLIPMATYFGKQGFETIAQMPESERRSMAAWFLLANLNSTYGRSVDSQLNKDIKIILESDGFPFKKLQEAMKARRYIDLEYIQDGLRRNVLREANKAFTFLLYVLLVKNQAEDWDAHLIASCDLRDLEKHHIFPQEYLRRELELDDVEDPADVESTVSNLANITFIHKPVNAEINDSAPASYLRQYIDQAKLHFIPNKPTLWTGQAYKDGAFQNERMELIFEAAQKYFPEVFFRLPPTTS